MSDLSDNVEKLKKQVKTFSSYYLKESDKEVKSNAFTDLRVNDKILIEKIGKKKVLLLILIPLLVAVVLLVLKPNFIMTKKSEDDVPITNKINLLLLVSVVSCFIIFILLKKTSFFK